MVTRRASRTKLKMLKKLKTPAPVGPSPKGLHDTSPTAQILTNKTVR